MEDTVRKWIFMDKASGQKKEAPARPPSGAEISPSAASQTARVPSSATSVKSLESAASSLTLSPPRMCLIQRCRGSANPSHSRRAYCAWSPCGTQDDSFCLIRWPEYDETR
jgi:hypothetical protein